MLKIVLAALDEALYTAWQTACGDLDFVSVHKGSILEAPCDAVVSPANSFGFMDGGIDALYTDYFGEQLGDQLQRIIRFEHRGELLVGMAEVVVTGHPKIPYLVAAPTMRVPMILKDSVNPYLAARAALIAAMRSPIKVLAIPGLGTGVGRVPPDICARQVRAAIDEVIVRKNEFPNSWREAQTRHQQLFSSSSMDLQRGS